MTKDDVKEYIEKFDAVYDIKTNKKILINEWYEIFKFFCKDSFDKTYKKIIRTSDMPTPAKFLKTLYSINNEVEEVAWLIINELLNPFISYNRKIEIKELYPNSYKFFTDNENRLDFQKISRETFNLFYDEYLLEN